MEIKAPFAHPVYARGILDCLSSRGISPLTVLSRVGLRWQDFCDGRIMDHAVFREFVTQAIQCSGEAALGLMAGSMLQPYHSPVGIGAVTSPYLGDALRFQSRYARLQFGNVAFRLDNGPRWSILQVKVTCPLAETREFVIQFIIGAHCRLLEGILGRPADELAVGLPYARAGDQEPCLGYVRAVEFGHEHLTLRLPTELLGEPCLSANAEELQEATRTCRRMEMEQSYGEFARRVRQALFDRLTMDPESHELAADLGVSAQTLARRLAEVGTKYSDMKNDLRKSQATWYLEHTELSIEAIASQLGYADPANFSRAFKRWHCMTPRSMRQTLRSGASGSF